MVTSALNSYINTKLEYEDLENRKKGFQSGLSHQEFCSLYDKAKELSESSNQEESSYGKKELEYLDGLVKFKREIKYISGPISDTNYINNLSDDTKILAKHITVDDYTELENSYKYKHNYQRGAKDKRGLSKEEFDKLHAFADSLSNSDDAKTASFGLSKLTELNILPGGYKGNNDENVKTFIPYDMILKEDNWYQNLGYERTSISYDTILQYRSIFYRSIFKN